MRTSYTPPFPCPRRRRRSLPRQAAVVAALAVLAVACSTSGSSGDDADEIAGCKIEAQTSCPNANLADAHLSGANLSGSDLSGVDLSGANLSGANLSGAILIGATATDANFTRANLSHADLEDANFDGSNLTEANLSGINFEGFTFEGSLRCHTIRADGSEDNEGCPPDADGGSGGVTTTTAASGGDSGAASCSAAALGGAYNAQRGTNPGVPDARLDDVGFACGGRGNEWAVVQLPVGGRTANLMKVGGGWRLVGIGRGRLCEGGIPGDLCTQLWDEIPTAPSA